MISRDPAADEESLDIPHANWTPPFRESWRSDLGASVVVFLVALPLCLGIALASGAPLFSGIITGVIGGIVVGALSGSHLMVSGPAAGLTAIVLSAITTLGSFETFLVAVFLAGLLQIGLGLLRAGVIGYYFPNAVIRGMLGGIGIIIILKQIPHAFGYDADPEGDEAFLQANQENTFSSLLSMFENVQMGAILLSILSLAILIFWDQKFMKRFALIPGRWWPSSWAWCSTASSSARARRWRSVPSTWWRFRSSRRSRSCAARSRSRTGR